MELTSEENPFDQTNPIEETYGVSSKEEIFEADALEEIRKISSLESGTLHGDTTLEDILGVDALEDSVQAVKPKQEIFEVDALEDKCQSSSLEGVSLQEDITLEDISLEDITLEDITLEDIPGVLDLKKSDGPSEIVELFVPDASLLERSFNMKQVSQAISSKTTVFSKTTVPYITMPERTLNTKHNFGLTNEPVKVEPFTELKDVFNNYTYDELADISEYLDMVFPEIATLQRLNSMRPVIEGLQASYANHSLESTALTIKESVNDYYENNNI